MWFVLKQLDNEAELSETTTLSCLNVWILNIPVVVCPTFMDVCEFKNEIIKFLDLNKQFNMT
jgi:hypothetical protein